MAEHNWLMTAGEFKARYQKEVHSLGDAIKFAVEKYKRLLANWDKATARELADKYIGTDTCALCRFSDNRCFKCPLLLKSCAQCTDETHPWSKLFDNLDDNRKARARKHAEEILRILKKKARQIK